MLGKCTTGLPGAIERAISDGLEIGQEEPWAAPRCLLIISDDFLVVDRSRLWLDALHIQILGAQRTTAAVYSTGYGQLFVSNSVVQGDRMSSGIALVSQLCLGGIYAEGVPPYLY